VAVILKRSSINVLIVHLKSLLETAADVGATDFVQLVRTSGLEEKAAASNLTLFVPSDDAVRDFTYSMQEAVRILLFIQNCFTSVCVIECDILEKTYMSLFFYTGTCLRKLCHSYSPCLEGFLHQEI
jgi:hypothetical protein